MVNVSWDDADAFCRWLSKKEGQTYRLPTESQWEYACRAGTQTRYCNGDDPEGLAKVGNVADAAAKAKFSFLSWAIGASDGYVFTAPVGQFKPNASGLYDMHGNAFEWCADWYDAKSQSRLQDFSHHPGVLDGVVFETKTVELRVFAFRPAALGEHS